VNVESGWPTVEGERPGNARSGRDGARGNWTDVGNEGEGHGEDGKKWKGRKLGVEF